MKYVFMATSANFGNMFSMAGASLFLPFLPMLPKQIMLINFLTDLPEMSISSDNVDQAFLERPHRWDIAFIKRFMLVFRTAQLDLRFPHLQLAALGIACQPGRIPYRLADRVVLSASLVVFAVRTRLPFLRSRPNRAMLWMTALVGLVALILPYSPLAGILGLHPLPLKTLLAHWSGHLPLFHFSRAAQTLVFQEI